VTDNAHSRGRNGTAEAAHGLCHFHASGSRENGLALLTVMPGTQKRVRGVRAIERADGRSGVHDRAGAGLKACSARCPTDDGRLR